MRPGGIKKLYYSIREVSELTGIESHVLRFWEKEFSQLNPRRGRSGNRAYTERNIKVILAIKDLLYAQKYTIQGAVERLKIDRSLWENQSIEDATSNVENPLVELRRMLFELKQLIEGGEASDAGK
ncbi:MAG: MerR family transcriptional regulator [Gemmatimonadetes bacterium]|nr:MerR family transcriptional regulator [Gemmatimonadota bacterium]MXZ09889.1 MerR family transcriptional regulator [Gemmatimonadota bacterium]MYB56128.1 MerR family transcriptional regulator [Gemmatimonadota bacterium]MYC13133.1 MerR family transcriptional regulator [Gemmatimonadota bacterium]MYF72309.1 MerR family transcriptional regulator [Gemmatimonadota bacterium]